MKIPNLAFALWLSLSGLAIAAPGDLLTVRYTLRANVAYDTGLRGVYGGPGPVAVRTFRIYQTGNYCDISVSRVYYTTGLGSPLRTAYKGVDGYEIPEGSLFGIGFEFTQHSWDNADCDLTVRAVNGGGGGGSGIWFDLRTALSGSGADFTRNCGRTLRESLPGVQCYASRASNDELFCRDPQVRKSLLQQFSCVGSVFGPKLEPGYSIDWNQAL